MVVYVWSTQSLSACNFTHDVALCILCIVLTRSKNQAEIVSAALSVETRHRPASHERPALIS